LVTNTTSRTRASIAAALSEAGFAVTVADVLPAPVIAAADLAAHYPVPDACCSTAGMSEVKLSPEPGSCVR
jgi:hypothetical protein